MELELCHPYKIDARIKVFRLPSKSVSIFTTVRSSVQRCGTIDALTLFGSQINVRILICSGVVKTLHRRALRLT